MGRLEHIACGYSEYAPGCDDWGCLVHRIDFAVRKGWTPGTLQSRLDASVSMALDDALHTGTTRIVPVAADRRNA